MKRVIYLASSIALLTSMVLAGNALAARDGTHAKTATVKAQLCTSGPYGVPALKQLWQGVRNGVDLAVAQWKHKLSTVHVSIQPTLHLDDAAANGQSYDPNVEAGNANTCAGKSDTYAYIGTLNSGAALVSEPILNRDHMLMISPANTNPTLTDPASRSAQEPATASGKIKWVTYYRTVTTDKLQGPAGALYAYQKLHARSYWIVNDAKQYGVGLATYFAAEAKKLHMTQDGSGQIDPSSSATEATTSQAIAAQVFAYSQTHSGSPAVVYCGCDSETSANLPRDLRKDGYTKPFMGGDALFNTAWLSNSDGAGPGAANNDVTSVGPDPSKAAKSFVKAYKKMFSTFYKSPGIQAYDAPAYDAAGIALTAIYDAAKAHKLKGSILSQRTAVVSYVHSIKFKGATGTTSFNRNGDTNNKIISVYRSNKKSGTPTAWVFGGQLTAKGCPTSKC
jgi:branched-chain amino acid transport system substrate-binding protein